MRRKVLWSVGAAVLVGAALLLWRWGAQEPSVRPGEVRLEAILHPPGHGENLLPYGQQVWMLEIILHKETDQSLWTDDWSFAVTPVVDGLATPFWDHMQGLSASTGSPPAGGQGFVIIRDETVRKSVVRAMEAIGLQPGAQRWDETWGFRYHGSDFPARIRFYLDGGTPQPVDRIAVAYTHKERRLGRDLGWTRLFRAKVDEGPVARRPSPEAPRVAEPRSGPGEGLGYALLPSGELGTLRFTGGRVVLSRPEPNRLAVNAIFIAESGEWIDGANRSELVIGPRRPVAAAAELNPVQDRERKVPLWVFFGEVDDPTVTQVLLEVGLVTLMAPVENGVWVAAHLGALSKEEVPIQYMTETSSVRDRGVIRAVRPPRP